MLNLVRKARNKLETRFGDCKVIFYANTRKKVSFEEIWQIINIDAVIIGILKPMRASDDERTIN